MNNDGNCILSGREKESRDHLFFDCDFSKVVWKEILRLRQLQRNVMGWHQGLHWALERLKRKSLITLILKLAWIWKERNKRLFQGLQKIEEDIVKS
ncbi:hypothetical protein J1N35_021549 [Gossypium stocksii]|uniref:Reverse transcriptase zinc-binding domain-containing protein n=1 Tax=Gossypium stocksii TaxID=47602 RepID=A0A9D4A1E8_9ROSI|nr:hypothetical protein J1N35_021549 [Gossypium stocksii]